MPSPLQVILIIVGTSIWIALLGRLSRTPRRPVASRSLADGRQVLTFNWGARLSAFVTLTIALTLLVLLAPVQAWASPRDHHLGLAIVVLPLAIAAAWAAGQSLYTKLVIGPDGLAKRSLLRSQQALAWQEVVDVHYSIMAQWFIITGRAGQRMRISRYLNGLELLFERLDGRVPHPSLARARSILASAHWGAA